MKYDIVILGGGPAGITASIYSIRKKLKTILITKDFIGQVGLTGNIENWPGEESILGIDLMNKFTNHLQSYSPKIIEEEVTSVTKDNNLFLIKTKTQKLQSRAVIITTGRKPKKLNIPGEKEFTGRGVVYCTTCDAPLFENKKVVVVGGGNSGFEAAIEMTDYTKDVSLYEVQDKFMADEILVEKAKKKNVNLIKNIKLKEIKGNDFVETIICEDMRENKTKEIKADGVFIQIGSTANTKCVDSLTDKNSCGDIKINPESNETSTPGLFAAGDVSTVREKQIVIAAGEGAKAALSAYQYIKND